ncbi:hypothetical protein EDD15DRAFT_2198164 [Pisolithus albus]|nr:hypothetical protein EDD15DRAFT_2198164 [Pisolithus albus]
MTKSWTIGRLIFRLGWSTGAAGFTATKMITSGSMQDQIGYGQTTDLIANGELATRISDMLTVRGETCVSPHVDHLVRLILELTVVIGFIVFPGSLWYTDDHQAGGGSSISIGLTSDVDVRSPRGCKMATHEVVDRDVSGAYAN